MITDQGEMPLFPGMCAGFKAGTGNGHQLVNRANKDILYLEVGDRTAGDSGTYPTTTYKPYWVMTGSGSSCIKMEHPIETQCPVMGANHHCSGLSKKPRSPVTANVRRCSHLA
jgi:hypothetical protein